MARNLKQRPAALAPSYARQRRTTRRPQHPFNVISKPYQIQPIGLAPVLPGETLKNLMLQSQVWSDPLAGTMKNIGWWCEYFFFYVRHRDLNEYTIAADGIGRDLVQMMTENEDLSSHEALAANTATYCPKGGIDFVQECMERVAGQYFRDEGEGVSAYMIDNIPIAKIHGTSKRDVMYRLTNDADYEDRRVALDADGSGTITVDDIPNAYAEWAAAHDAGLTDMTYEDHMRTYGGTTGHELDPDEPDKHIPEDIAYFREYKYPTNTVDPDTGTPTTAIGFRVTSQARKSIRFDEPGWVAMYNVLRPKVYLQNQSGAFSAMMNDRNSWLPAVLHHEYDAGHKQIANGDGPLENITDAGGYWVDLKDLLMYGEQFVNHAGGAAPFVNLPGADGQRNYVSATDAMSMFSDTVNGRFRQDGIVSLSVLGRQTPTGRNLTLGQA